MAEERDIMAVKATAVAGEVSFGIHLGVRFFSSKEAFFVLLCEDNLPSHPCNSDMRLILRQEKADTGARDVVREEGIAEEEEVS